MIGAQGGVAGHLTMGKGSSLAAKSGLMRNVPPGVSGVRPAGHTDQGLFSPGHAVATAGEGIGQEGMSEPPASRPVIETIDIMRIMEMIPHRFPFLMIDRVVDLQPDVGAIGIKNVSINEPFFQGHFPRQRVMPGGLISRRMAQTAGVLVVETLEGAAAGKLVYFMTIDDGGSAGRCSRATRSGSTSPRCAIVAMSGSFAARPRSMARSWPKRTSPP